MKVMLLTKPAPIEEKPLRFAELPDPKCSADEILVKVSVCGACHTDLDEAEGRLMPSTLPMVPGHQAVGIVTEKGDAVTRFNLGDRVGVTWLYSSCGKCKSCKSGNENLCADAKWTGKDAYGGYAQYLKVAQNFAHPVPERFTDSQTAPLLCAGVIGYRALRLTGLIDGETIGLFGFGASAHIVIQILRYRFPNSAIFVFTRNPEHFEFARKLGAAWTGFAHDQPPAKLNCAIDFTPAGEIVRDAMGVLEKGGRLVINAIRKVTPIPEMDYAKYLWEEREIKSTANVTRADAAEFLPLAEKIPIIPQVEQFDLRQANEALLQIKNGNVRGAAVFRILH